MISLKIEDESFDELPHRKGRSEKVWLGINHFVSAKNWKNYKDDPYNWKGIISLFKELGPKYSFSCPFLLGRGGRIAQFGNIEDTLYHAGKSVISTSNTPYKTGLNSCSVGVEWVGKEGDGYTDDQYRVGPLLAEYIESYVIKSNLGKIIRWVGHDEVSGQIAVKLGVKKRSVMKVDPGLKFDWDRFNEGLWKLKLEKKLEPRIVEKRVEVVKPLKSYSKNQLFKALFGL